MNEINKQVARAHRRMMTVRFFSILTWSVFAGLFIGVIGLAIPKIWHLEFLQAQGQQDTWALCWIIGGAAFGFFVASVLTWMNRASKLDAAVEVDRRFGLKERLSSAMVLTPEVAGSNVGQALVEDAVNRAEGIDVRDQFQFRPTWRALLPIIPVLILVALIFIPNAEKKAVATEPEKLDRKRIEVAIKEFKKKLEEKREQAAATGLKDADPDLKSLEKKFDKLLDEKNTDKKEALVKLNDIKKQIEERRKELGGDSKELKDSLNKLKDVGQGPAKQLADAMSKGDMEEAKKAIKALADKLKAGDLNQIEMKKLAKDLEKMANELKKIAEKHEQDKKKLEDQIKKALDEGDLDKAAQLQQQLDQKKAMDKQQEKMKKMAENLQKCAECMKPGGNGDPKKGQNGQQQQPGQNGEQQAQAMKEAGESLEDLAEQIKDLQQQMDQMENLEDLEEMAEEFKNAMNQGGGKAGGMPKMADWQKGEGPGGGKRDLEEEETGSFRSRVKGKLQRGETVVTGDADGKNITGRSASETRELVRSSMSKDSDPLENQKLSRTQREHAEQYFRALRENN